MESRKGSKSREIEYLVTGELFFSKGVEEGEALKATIFCESVNVNGVRIKGYYMESDRTPNQNNLS